MMAWSASVDLRVLVVAVLLCAAAGRPVPQDLQEEQDLMDLPEPARQQDGGQIYNFGSDVWQKLSPETREMLRSLLERLKDKFNGLMSRPKLVPDSANERVVPGWDDGTSVLNSPQAEREVIHVDMSKLPTGDRGQGDNDLGMLVNMGDSVKPPEGSDRVNALDEQDIKELGADIPDEDGEEEEGEEEEEEKESTHEDEDDESEGEEDTKAVEHEHQPAPPSRMNKKQIVKKDGRMANWPGVYVHKKWDDSDSIKKSAKHASRNGNSGNANEFGTKSHGQLTEKHQVSKDVVETVKQEKGNGKEPKEQMIMEKANAHSDKPSPIAKGGPTQPVKTTRNDTPSQIQPSSQQDHEDEIIIQPVAQAHLDARPPAPATEGNLDKKDSLIIPVKREELEAIKVPIVETAHGNGHIKATVINAEPAGTGPKEPEDVQPASDWRRTLKLLLAREMSNF